MDALTFLLGEFESLSAQTHQHFDLQIADENGEYKTVPSTSPDSFTVQGTLKGGASASVHLVSTAETNPKELTWIIYGDKGALKIEGSSLMIAFGTFTLQYFKDGSWGDVEVEANNGVGEVYRAFAEDKKDSIVTFEEALVRHRMIEAVFKSARDGTRESYNTTF
jgi:predicted dehydrogenase